MSTHRRAWSRRAGVVVALVTGALLTVPATPALAAGVSVSPNSATIEAGGETTVTVTVTPGGTDEQARVAVNGLPSGVTCQGCNATVEFDDPAQAKSHSFTLQANPNAGAANRTVSVQVIAASGPGSATFTLTVRPKQAAPTTPAQAQTVRRISGKVTNSTNGKPVPNATVALMDSERHQYTTTTDEGGNWRFDGSAQRPITPGQIELGASFNDTRKTMSITAGPGQNVTGQRIALALPVEATASPTPTATEEAAPTEGPVEETPEEPGATPGAPANAAEEDSGGFGSWLLIILGGLFVAIGIGTIVLLLMRRRDTPGDDDDKEAGAAGATPGARGAYHGGADDATRVVNRVGTDPTMVGGASLADAPTMMHNRPLVDDVPPDPYGAPPLPPGQSYGAAGQGGWAGGGYGEAGPNQAGGYGEPTGSTPGGGYGAAGYGNTPSSGGPYGSAPSSGGPYGGASSGAGYGNAPSSGGGYGSRDYGTPGGGYTPPAQGGGYGERYDDPTGRFTEGTQAYTPPADPYPTSTYQPADGGYGQDPGYGRGPEPAGGYGGYGQQGGYVQEAPQPGGYGQDPQHGGYGYGQQGGGGYGSGGGYDQQGGYGGQQGGYGQEPQQGGYGYGQQGGGYGDHDQHQSRGRDGQPPQQDRTGRRLDWLDD